MDGALDFTGCLVGLVIGLFIVAAYPWVLLIFLVPAAIVGILQLTKWALHQIFRRE